MQNKNKKNNSPSQDLFILKLFHLENRKLGLKNRNHGSKESNTSSKMMKNLMGRKMRLGLQLLVRLMMMRICHRFLRIRVLKGKEIKRIRLSSNIESLR